MGKFKFLILIVFGLGLFLLLPENVKAETLPTHEVVINELMWMGSTTSTADEWIELRNMSSTQVNFSTNPWSIYKNGVLMLKIDKGILGPNGFFVISNYSKEGSVINIEPDIINTAVSLSNSAVQYKLYNKADSTGELVDVADDGSGDPLAGDNGAKLSMERNYHPSDGTKAENWHTAVKSVGFDSTAISEKGTPGSDNSSIPIVLPKLISPADGAIFIGNASFEFEWEEESDLKNQLIVSKKDDLSSPILDISTLEAGKYYWAVLVSNDRETKQSEVWSFELKDYSNAIIISELYPDPSSGEEWIEFYNNSSEIVNLKGWILEDGGLNRHSIGVDLFVEPFGYAAIFYSDSKITLNNDGDLINLYNPNNQLVYATPKYTPSDKGWSFARGPDGVWTWTTTPTAGGANIMTSPVTEGIAGISVEEIKIPVNSEPVNIQTGEAEKYRDYLVRISGEITRTSGATFYLDDGSGEVKVYIQDKTGIQKPKMYAGDIFEIFGIVNFYRGAFRILPQKQNDIRLIKHLSTAKTKKTAKTATEAVSLAGSIHKVAAAEDSSGLPPKQTTKTPFWVQLVEALVAMATIVLIFFLVRISQVKKEHPIGHNFGNDDT